MFNSQFPDAFVIDGHLDEVVGGRRRRGRARRRRQIVLVTVVVVFGVVLVAVVQRLVLVHVLTHRRPETAKRVETFEAIHCNVEFVR